MHSGLARIPVAGPSITQKEIDYVADAAATAWYADANVYHERFERAFAQYVDRRFAMAFPSCTAAIHITLAALGIGPGDEVIVPDATWIATAAPIDYVGATPVFADIDASSWCLSVQSVRERITPRTKAIIAVDLYGNVGEWETLEALADERGIHLIEDAAEAVGAERHGRKAGNFGLVGVFSFHGSKTLTTGEGGMLVTSDEALYRRAGILRDHGRIPGDTDFMNSEVAFKYKMSSMQAALGLAQLERIDDLIEMKRQAFGWYREELNDLSAISLNVELPDTRSSYWMITAVLDRGLGVTARQVRESLAGEGIDTRPFFHPLSSLPAYRHLDPRGQNPVSYSISPFALNLPSSLSLTRSDVRRVGAALRQALEK